MTDEDLADNVIQLFAQFERWDVWHDFKFAESNGLNMTFFLPAIRIALHSKNLHGGPVSSTPELEQELLQALRKRARHECGLGPVAVEQSHPSFFPNADFDKTLRPHTSSKRAGDIRKYSADDVEEASRLLQENFPDLFDAITKVIHHNFGSDPKFRETGNVNVHGFRWLLEPIQHALFRMYPELDIHDNSELAVAVFYRITEYVAGASQ